MPNLGSLSHSGSHSPAFNEAPTKNLSLLRAALRSLACIG